MIMNMPLLRNLFQADPFLLPKNDKNSFLIKKIYDDKISNLMKV